MTERFIWIFVLGILSVTTTGATDCPDLWIPYQGSCYLFGHQNLTFFEAEHYCQAHEAHLVLIESQEENAFIRDHISYSSCSRYKQWWIGLTDDDVEGMWVWTATNEKPDFTDWGPNEPNGGHRESCGEFLQYLTNDISSAHWNDAPCSNHLPMICEKPPGNTENIGLVG